MERPERAPDAAPQVPRLDLDYEDIEQLEPLGQGGSADVHLARVVPDGTELEVALKQPRMHGTLHQETVERFREEAETWAGLDDHDNVVGVVDWGTEPLPWLALEYMDAGSLRDQLDEAGGRLPPEQAAWTALSITRAVRHAHRHGVAHLDLKPENVLARTPSDGQWPLPKVSDWGLARLMLDHSGSVEGLSPQYAAPEQFDADTYGSPDDRTDVYQLGAVAYELFAGQPPFDGSATAVMSGVLSEDPDPPSAVADVPPAVDDAVMPALAKHPEDRYDDVIYLRDALADLLADLQSGDAAARDGTGTSSPGSASGPSGESVASGAGGASDGSGASGTAGSAVDGTTEAADPGSAPEEGGSAAGTAEASPGEVPAEDDTAHEGPARDRPTEQSDDGSRLLAGAVVAGYVLLGLVLSVVPVFLVSFDEIARAYPAMGGGVVVFAAGALRATGRSGPTTRGVAVFGTAVFLLGTVFLFIL